MPSIPDYHVQKKCFLQCLPKVIFFWSGGRGAERGRLVCSWRPCVSSCTLPYCSIIILCLIPYTTIWVDAGLQILTGLVLWKGEMLENLEVWNSFVGLEGLLFTQIEGVTVVDCRTWEVVWVNPNNEIFLKNRFTGSSSIYWSPQVEGMSPPHYFPKEQT